MTIPSALDPAAAVRTALPDVLLDTVEFRGETTLVVARERIVEVATVVRDTPGLVYNFLSDISAVDYWEPYGGWGERPERFAVSYHLLSMLYKRRLRLKVYVPEDNPVVPTIIGIWPAANWLEREIHDLMGIYFDGHPDQRRLMLPDDWQGHPHRRDYPLGYETIMFSFNADEIMKHKPFAKE
ncbi:MAG: NADH-quinone oxidoreductase subunit C [Chloroflexi bacterium]|nr:NADH-quinone oxidoreductase subunit C [Chloroflexota bacterium]MDL1882449.1 NADH-quinone oxidoreductase subunit C [Anaerolineae bacterium CFX8]